MSNEWPEQPRHANPQQRGQQGWNQEVGPSGQYYGGQPYPQYQQPPRKKKHTVRNVILTLFALAILGGGAACTVFVFAASDAVNTAVTEAESSDAEPGGPDNPLEIKQGEAFAVSGFEYKKGWKLKGNEYGIEVTKLRVTNNRPDKDGALIEIKLWQGSEVVALLDCTTEQIDVGTTTKVDCLSGDEMPKDYDRITINDIF